MVSQKTITISDYEKVGLVLLKKKRKCSFSELIREGIRLLMEKEGIKLPGN